MAEKNSLWKNIRNKAKQNRKTGAKPKKPTAEMLRQERKIKAKQYPDGGGINPGKQKAVASTTDVSVRALPEGLFEQIKANPPARQPEIINIVDKRKWNPVTNKPINPNRDLVGGKFEDPIVNKTIISAYNNEVDPYIALAIGLQESGLGKTDPNIGHLLYSNEDYTPGVDEMVSFIKEKENYAKKLGYKDKEHFIQAYNGLGKVFPETEQDYHGFKMKSIYGVPVPKEGIDLAKNPLYGKRIINIADSVLKQNPQIVRRVEYYKPKMDGGYMYYAGGPMYYGDGGKVWKHIGAGAYALGEGMLDTITMGATDQLTDKGFEWLTKVGNKNLDLSNPKNAKFLKVQKQIKGYGNFGGAATAAVLTGNVQGAIGQGTKGLDTAFQASDWASDDFKKWSQGISGVAGIAAGFAGGLNSDSFNAAAKAGTGIAGFGQKAGKIGSFGNQVTGMFGGNQQSLLEQAEARQDYLNSPEYLAMKEKQNQAYVNQGLSFAANGGPVNNNLLTLQTGSMRKNINNYRRKYKEGGQVDVNDKLTQFGLHKIQNGGKHWQNPKKGVIVGNASVEEDEVLKFAEGGSANLSNAEYVYPDTVNDEFTLPMYKPNESLTDFELDKDGNPIPLDMTPAEFLIKEGTKGSPFRKINTLAKIRMNNAEAITRKARDLGMAINEQNQQNQQMMVEGALQYAAAGGNLNKDLEKILSDDIQSYVEADNYYAYGGYLPKDKGFNMPNSYAKGGSIHIKKSKRGTFTAAAKKRGKSVQEFARQVLANKGNYSAAMVKKANFARNAAKWHHAEGGNIRPDNPGFNALPEYVQDKIINNMAYGGNMYQTPYANGGELNSIDDDDIIKNNRSYRVRRNMFDKIVSVEKYTDEDGSKWKIKNKYNPDTKENVKTYWVDGKFSGRTINQDEPEYIPVKQRIEFNNQPSVVYAHGGPVVSNIPQDFDLYAQNRGGMMMANGGNMYAVGGPGKRIIGIDEYGNPIYQNITTMSTQPIQPDVNYGDDYFLNRQSSIPMENYDANVTKPSTPVKGKINSQPGISYTQPEKTIDDFYQESQISQKVSEPIDFTSPLGTFEGVDASGNPVSINPALKETYNQGWRPEGASIPKVNQPKQPNQGLTGLDYASMIGQAAAGFHQLGLGLKGGDPVNYERVTGEKIDPTVAIALAAEEGRRAQDSAAYLMRQSAPTSGSYMNNLRNLSLQSGKQRGALAGGLRYQADLTNTQMQNELNKVNAGISMQEQIDRLQEKDAARTNITEGLSGLGSTTANVIRDYRTNQINQTIANNIGTNNFKFDPVNETITYRNQNGEMVTVPAQTVIPPNVATNVGTGQIQQPGTSQFETGFGNRLNESFRNRFRGPNAGK